MSLKDFLYVDHYFREFFLVIGEFPANHKRFSGVQILKEIYLGSPLVLAVCDQSDFEDFEWLWNGSLGVELSEYSGKVDI